MPIAELSGIWKTYQMGLTRVDALRGLEMAVEQGELLAIMGPSGSGKSTLLNILGCLDRPSSGRYELRGRDVSRLSDNELSEVRSTQIGFIFQSYNLIPQLNVVENIEVPLYYQGVSERASYRRAVELAEVVGLGDRLHHLPTELSGGQRQRVGVARALANDPAIVLADEPTGNLDTQTGAEIMELLLSLNRQRGTTLLLVTHDPKVASVTGRTLHMVDGAITNGSAEKGEGRP